LNSRPGHFAVLFALAAISSGTCQVAAATSADVGAPTVSTTLSAAPTDSAKTTANRFLQNFNASFDATLASRYLFQGLDYSDGKSVVQPNLQVSHGPIAAVAWANYQPNLGDVNEVDLSLQASQTVERLSGTVGYTYLRYPNRIGWDPSQEVFANLSVTSPLNPTLSIHYDFDAGNGGYSTLGLSQTFASIVTFGSNLFYQSHYYGMTGIPSVEIKAGAAFPYAGMSLTPSVSRFFTHDNGDFTAPDAHVSDGWLVSLNIVPRP